MDDCSDAQQSRCACACALTLRSVQAKRHFFLTLSELPEAPEIALVAFFLHFPTAAQKECTHTLTYTMEQIASVNLRSEDYVHALVANNDVVVAAVNHYPCLQLPQYVQGVVLVFDAEDLRMRQKFTVLDKRGFWVGHGRQIALNPVDGSLLIMDGGKSIEIYDLVHGKRLGHVKLQSGYFPVSIVTRQTSAESCVAGLRLQYTYQHLCLTFHVGLGWTEMPFEFVDSLPADITAAVCNDFFSNIMEAVTPDGRIMFSYSKHCLSLRCRAMSALRVAWMTAVVRSQEEKKYRGVHV